MQKLRVILADDHPVVLAGVSDLFLESFDYELVASVTSSSALIHHIVQDTPDVVITDYSMPGDGQYGDGLRLIEYLRRTFPAVRIVVLTMVSNPMILSALYMAGVSAVVLKQDNMSEIVKALDNLRHQRCYYPPGYRADENGPQRAKPLDARIQSLSPREFEVLRHFVRGATVMEIAERLKRSVKTVSTQKQTAMRKLGLQTDQDLIAYCLESNLFD